MRITTPLFGIPVHTVAIDPVSHDAVNYITNSNFIKMTTGDGYITDNVRLLDDPNCLEIKNKVINSINEYVYNILNVKLETEFYITTSWAVKFQKGGWGQEHTHGNSLFSGVLYLKASENTGQISFHNNNRYSNICSPTIQLEYTQWNIFNSEKWSITPEENHVIIFPSNLTHSVEINNSNSDRISIAFNVFVKGEFGIYESYLAIK